MDSGWHITGAHSSDPVHIWSVTWGGFEKPQEIV